MIEELNDKLSYRLNQDNVIRLGRELRNIINDAGTIFINIQVPSESSQYDILLSHNYYNQGLHQNGIIDGYILIGIVGYKLHGFTYNSEILVDTTPDYYCEKLGVYSELLSNLFNIIREEV